MKRRKALKNTALIGGSAFTASMIPGLLSSCNSEKKGSEEGSTDPEEAAVENSSVLFSISLAQWSLNRSFFGKSRELGWEEWGNRLQNDPSSLIQGELDPLNFPVIAKNDYGIDAVEYVNTFYYDKATDEEYLRELKSRCDNEGVTSVLIMCDALGNLGDPDKTKRSQAVENHHPWVDAAKYLGCHSIRVNARSQGSYEEQQKLAADGLRKLCEYGEQQDIYIIVENHGGLSSNGQWLTGVMEMVDHPRAGTLPDFGNFRIEEGDWYDRYKGVKELMPYAKGVSAKSHEFDDQGNEIHTDYKKMMDIVLDAGYHGYVGIEYEGDAMSEPEGIKATKVLLENVRRELG